MCLILSFYKFEGTNKTPECGGNTLSFYRVEECIIHFMWANVMGDLNERNLLLVGKENYYMTDDGWCQLKTFRMPAMFPLVLGTTKQCDRIL